MFGRHSKDKEGHRRSTGSAGSAGSAGGASAVRIPASVYDGRRDGEGEGEAAAAAAAGPPSARISVRELRVPNAKKSLPTATVTVKAKGFAPVTGVPLDLLGRGTHVYRMSKLDVRNISTGLGLGEGVD